MTVIERPSPRRQAATAWSQVRDFASRHRSISIIIGMALIGIFLPIVASVPPLSAFQPFNAWLDGFSNAGTFGFYCEIHYASGMKGAVIVE